MTNPSLSIQTTEQIGRLYQHPGAGYPKKISSTAARKGLADGSLVPSITNVLGAMNPDLLGYVAYMFNHRLQEDGLTWDNVRVAKKEHITYLNNAAERGTRVHKAVEDFIEAGFAIPERVEQLIASGVYKHAESYKEMQRNHAEFGDLNHFEAFLKFVTDFKPKFIHQEATVFGATDVGLAYAGTTDAIAEINGKIYVMDWKTSSKMSYTVAGQLAAVIKAESITTDFQTLHPVPHIDGARGIHLAKDGNYGVYKANVEEGWDLFQSLRLAWQYYAFKGDYNSVQPLIKKVA